MNIGDHTLKNISRPIRVYKIPVEPGEVAEAEKKRRSSMRSTTQRDSPSDGALIDELVTREPANPDEYYLTGFICLGVAVGLPIFGYFIGQIAWEAFFPMVGAGVLVGLIGITFLLLGKFLDHRAKAVNDGDRQEP
ncbi:MAG: hypothetical protein V3S89_12400 [Desulfobacterales bacterium]